MLEYLTQQQIDQVGPHYAYDDHIAPWSDPYPYLSPSLTEMGERPNLNIVHARS
jgi:hypothetical protein